MAKTIQSSPQSRKVFTYTWQGVNQEGQALQGELTGVGISLIKAELRSHGITPIKVRKKPRPLFSYRTRKIHASDISLFIRQLATLMTAGVPIIQAFDIIAKGQSNPNSRTLLLNIKSDIETGTPLAQALRKFPRYFNTLFCNLIAAGEQSGTLETMLDKIATYQEKMSSLISKIKKALLYPSVIITVAIAVTVILLVFVVPQFEVLFRDFGAELPFFTRLVLSLSAYIQQYWLWMGGAFSLAIWLAIVAKKRYQKCHRLLDKYTLKLPIVGDILQQAIIARFTRTVATTFTAGLPLVDTLEIVAGTLGNLIYRDAILQMREAVATGQQLHMAIATTGAFSNMVIQMISIGEETGTLDMMLHKVADYYEDAVDHKVDSLSSLLEPCIMVVLGILVGGLVTAMYLPIFQLGTVI